MLLRTRIVVGALAVSLLAGCAAGAGSPPAHSFMGKCTSQASTEQERSECAWENAERMAGGR